MSWISVKDELPESENDYLVGRLPQKKTFGTIKTTEHFPLRIARFIPAEDDCEHIWVTREDFDGYNPTHWMSLPASPKDVT